MVRLLFIMLITLPAFAQSPSQLEEDLKAYPDRMTTRMQLAGYYVKQNEFDRVIGLLNAYTDQLPTEGFLALASSYSNKKDFTNEIRVLALLVAKHEGDYRWQMLLAEAYLKSASLQTDLEKNRDLTTPTWFST